MRTDCGCGCGGDATRTSAFVRPRFFAGQLLTEDDLGLLVDYTTAKSRLHNRSLYGPGVICGLGVTCAPCGGGTVAVHPGHALDCAGNDIVVSCTEQVDVQALVRERRVSALGVDCGEDCDDEGGRRYGLYVRYHEQPVEPVAPYATEEPCPSPGCVPSRVQEGFRFVVKCADDEDHRHNPGTRLLAGIGDLTRADRARTRDRRLQHYLDALSTAAAAIGRTFRFDAADAGRYATSLAWLRQNAAGEGPPPPPAAREMTEHVRALASAVARFDTHDAAGRRRLTGEYPDLGTVQEARGLLGTACGRLAATDQEAAWPDPLRRSLARAVVTETATRIVPEQGDADAPLEVRMLAQGTPLSHALRVEFRADLGLVREWLLCRLDQSGGGGDCGLRTEVAAVDVPPPLPAPPPDSTERATVAEVQRIAEATAALTVALRRFLTDTACATLNPPCGDCTDTDVLLAHVELDGCDVVRICSATREQVLPGGSAYGEWLPKLYRLRELAERLCCRPAPRHPGPQLPPEGDVPRPYATGLLGDWPRTGDLEEMLSLLLTPAPGETPPKALHEQVYTTPSEVTDSMHELAVLRTQVAGLTSALEGLRTQLGSAQTEMARLREQVRAPAGPAGGTDGTTSGAPDGTADGAPEETPDAPPDREEPTRRPARRGRSSRGQKPGETP
ncbi:hypothetical protein E2C00_19675 [Streptomyces sp. WAC05374]|uniref:hypothetical protein n=1 Tax=Streptomyces sp. WAC05374 TaxID=2487420 RepID=UPI000F8748CF|nr:hypothetical protein [Streptomyces sp. WAC05374]RST10117.1 hypothetical protein EF905_28000 [Streptomyces sp. WAC05374]TDF37920.1 hypothetical protein E2B92_28880 [Streptomyces sp. WAC05374]TDF52776.1 hypothetical protein E2C02_21145 [Streptomyces sp. WAC05374]TDF54195.1 hypothetical protein E2C00_19675 [Streptomyces sp. WAC05374]